MAKVYHVVITSTDVDTNEQNIELDENYIGLTLIADNEDGKSMSEVIIHDNIANMAAKLASGDKTRIALKLARVMDDMKSDRMSAIEDLLSDAIGGVQ